MNKLGYLSQISIFEALPMEDLMEIDRMAPMTTLRKKMMIQSPDTFREGLYIIKEGKLRLFKINPEGKLFIVGILGKGNVFGEIDTFSLGTRDVYVETMEDTLLCSLGKEQFEKLLADRPRLALELLKVLSERLKDRDEMLEQLALSGVRDRVLHLLLKLCEQFGVADGKMHKIDLPLSHQELANMLGASRESVTVVLNQLVKEKVLATGRMSIHLNMAKVKDALLHNQMD
jgi:CRP-like cAMP-binding protein